MFDALFYCYALVNMNRSGCELIATECLLAAKARWRAMRAAMTGSRNNRPVPHPAAICHVQTDWVQRLARLETYVTAMA